MRPIEPEKADPIRDVTVNTPPTQDLDFSETDTVKEDHLSADEIPTHSLNTSPLSSVDGSDREQFEVHPIFPTTDSPASDSGRPWSEKSGALQTSEELTQIFCVMEPSLLRFARIIVGDHHLAEDVVNTSFAKAHSNFHKFEQESSIKTWIYRIVRNEAIDVLKEKKRFPAEIKDAQLHTLISGESEPIQTGVRKETCQLVHDTLAKLSETDRQILTLTEMEGLSYKKIKVLLKINKKNTAAKRAERARKRFREIYPASQSKGE
jgi:RNA polymerase sigma-70 factor (ECF subfamily)